MKTFLNSHSEILFEVSSPAISAQWKFQKFPFPPSFSSPFDFEKFQFPPISLSSKIQFPHLHKGRGGSRYAEDPSVKSKWNLRTTIFNWNDFYDLQRNTEGLHSCLIYYQLHWKVHNFSILGHLRAFERYLVYSGCDYDPFLKIQKRGEEKERQVDSIHKGGEKSVAFFKQ